VATVLDVTESREVDSELARLAGEQAALRRVATLVAREAPQIEVFAEIAQGIGQLLGAEEIRMFRYEDNRTAMVVAAAGEDPDLMPVGARHPLGGDNATSRVFTTRQPARIDHYETATGQIGDVVREGGIRAVVATPIMVEGRLWGALVTATTRDEPLPPDTESRMSQFTELMATAIANTESRAEVERLADEQAALRRVATLIARESSPVDVFGEVVEEVARVLGTEAVGMLRFEPGGTATLVAQSATPWDPPPIGTSFTLEGENLIAAVYRTGKVARTDDWGNATGSVAAMASVLGVRSSVATPIVVEGRLWGTMIAATSQREPLPADTESRTAQFTELLGTAIANAQARGEVERLANEQAAMRRVATLVAQGIPPTEVFPAVAAEVSVLFGSDVSAIVRFENDGSVTVLGDVGGPHEAGARVTLDRGYVVHTVRETRRSARFDTDDPPAADTGSLVRSLSGRRWRARSSSRVSCGEPSRPPHYTARCHPTPSDGSRSSPSSSRPP
jgi:GAF domain-containing protein